jgi:hypothetical protein
MIELLSTLFVTTPGTSLHLDGDAIRAYHPDVPGHASSRYCGSTMSSRGTALMCPTT